MIDECLKKVAVMKKTFPYTIIVSRQIVATKSYVIEAATFDEAIHLAEILN